MGQTWKEFEIEASKIEGRIKKIGVQRTELEKKIIAIKASYAAKEKTWKNTESEEGKKAIEELKDLESAEIKETIALYDEKAQKEIASIELTLKDLNEKNELQKEHNSLTAEYDKQLSKINKKITGAENAGAKNLVITYERQRQLITDIYTKKQEDLALSEMLARKQIEYNKDLFKIEKERDLLNESTLDALKREEKRLSIQLDYVLDRRDTIGEEFLTAEEILNINKELDKIYENQVMNLHKQRLETDLLYNAFWKLKGEAGTFNDLMRKSVSDFAVGMGTGMGDMMFQLSTGFQGNKQQVVDLKGEIKELKKEKDELTSTGILSADEAERLKEVNKEINNLKGDINDLENPIKSLGETFKNFFKDLIDQINAAITKWIALKIVMGITDSFMGGGDTGGYTQFIGGGQSAGFKADGGILGNITAFKKFSNGGTINNPTLAMIGEGTGDNREIVVPMKNIKQNHVEGYMKEPSEPIVNILNVITDDDLAMQMAKPKIGQVIVNRVYQNKTNQGILSRR